VRLSALSSANPLVQLTLNLPAVSPSP